MSVALAQPLRGWLLNEHDQRTDLNGSQEELGPAGRAAQGASTPARSALRSGRGAMDGETSELTLEQLMELYTQGGVDAFDELYRRTSHRVFGYLFRLTRHRERAEDLLQVTYSKLHRARDSYLLGAPLMPWMLAIARRSFLDERRRASSRSEDLSVDGVLPEPESVPTAHLPTDTVDALERAMNRLPSNYREAIELTKVSGLSIAEAAEVLGTTPQAVKLRVHRGYAQLRKSLESFSRGTP